MIKKTGLVYVTLRVKRPMTKAEDKLIDEIDDPVARTWERERQSLLFEIAVLAKNEAKAIRLLRSMLKSPKLIIELRNGVPKNVAKIPPTKPKRRRV
jgi:hypothetical protein